MDIASLLGVILGIGMVLFGIIQNGGVPALLNFLDAPSAIITIGGSLSAVLCSNKLSGFIAGIKSFALPFKEKSVDPGETINKIIEFNRKLQIYFENIDLIGQGLLQSFTSLLTGIATIVGTILIMAVRMQSL